MQRKSVADFTATRTSRIDRFAQMSKVEQVIEQKKREIQARLQKPGHTPENASSPTQIVKSPPPAIPKPKSTDISGSNEKTVKKIPSSPVNIFSNDGSFLDQFKQLSGDKKCNSRYKSSNKSHSNSKNADPASDTNKRDKRISDRLKSSRWSNRDRERPSSPYSISKDHYSAGHFSDRHDLSSGQTKNYYKNHYATDVPKSQNIKHSPPIPTPLIATNFPPPLFSAPLSLPPPQIQLTNTLVIAPLPAGSRTQSGICIPPPMSLPSSGHVSIPPPSMQPDITTIPTPNPISVHNIPQPEPLNALSIPPPAPLQLQNIPPPSPIRLNEIPNPKPLDIQSIPAPGESMQLNDKNLINTDVFKNVPPPNKSVPPPCLPSSPAKCETNSIVSIDLSIPPPISNTVTPTVQTMVPPPTILPPPNSNLTSLLPPPIVPPQTFSKNSVGAVLVLPTPTPVTAIPALMAQPVLPPAGMGMCVQPQIRLAPPTVVASCIVPVTGPTAPPPLITQPPPMSSLAGSIPPMTVPPPMVLPPNTNSVCPIGSASLAAMTSVARMVAQCGTSFEDVVRQRSHQDPNMWFLYNKHSPAYRQFQDLVDQFKSELKTSPVHTEYQPDEIYEPDTVTDDVNSGFFIGTESDDINFIPKFSQDFDEDLGKKDGVDCKFNFKAIHFQSSGKTKATCDSDSDPDASEADRIANRKKRKRKSRWGEQAANIPPPAVISSGLTPITLPSQVTPMQSHIKTSKKGPMLTKVTRSDPALIQYAINSFGSANLTEEEWQKAEDHYKINLLYQDMLRKREELERLQKAGKFKYEYDSDEEVDGGTWEHKIRMQEMEATQLWATELTKKAEGKHHIGDFLPPDELRRFMEQSTAAKEGREPDLSDYKEYKLKADNIGFQMLQKLGWSEGQGLGVEGSGIIEPVNKAPQRDLNQGLGINIAGGVTGHDDEYDAYRKRMMLAYRFRPNPLNNPRRPYY